MKKQPVGFLATCAHCGVDVGAIDFERTDRKEAGKIISNWLMSGCAIVPKFQHNWSVKIEKCKCNA